MCAPSCFCLSLGSSHCVARHHHYRDQDDPNKDGGDSAPVVDARGVALAARGVAPVACSVAQAVRSVAPAVCGVALVARSITPVPVAMPCATGATPRAAGATPIMPLLDIEYLTIHVDAGAMA
jgi:hypothetical protein